MCSLTKEQEKHVKMYYISPINPKRLNSSEGSCTGYSKLSLSLEGISGTCLRPMGFTPLCCTVSLPLSGTVLFLNYQGYLLHLVQCVWLNNINLSVKWTGMMFCRKSDDQGPCGPFIGESRREDQATRLESKGVLLTRKYEHKWLSLPINSEKWIVQSVAAYWEYIRNHIQNGRCTSNCHLHLL